MRDFLSKLYASLRDDQGQDLIEYALVIVMIAFAAAAGMQGVAGKINNTFGTIGNKLTSYVGT